MTQTSSNVSVQQFVRVDPNTKKITFVNPMTGQIIKPMSPPDLIEYEKKSAEEYNRMSGSLNLDDGIDCPLCRNRGDFHVVDDKGNISTRLCKCWQQRTAIRNIKASGLKRQIKENTFDNYITDTQWKAVIKHAVENYVESSQSEWLWLGGQSGSGKTHLCTAVCGELIRKNHFVKYVQWKPLVKKMAALQFDTAYEQLMTELQNVEILYIDDFLKTTTNSETHRPKPPTDSMLGYAFEIINCRYISGKKTLISSEFHLEDIKNFDEATAGRIKEMAGKGRYVFNIRPCEDRNYRWC